MLEKSPDSDQGQLPFITLKRAAQIIQCNPKTLLRYIRNGIGPPVRYFGNGRKKMMRLRYKAFMDWAEGRKK